LKMQERQYTPCVSALFDFDFPAAVLSVLV